ncbi:nitroreductase [Brevundimonas sp.]|jgi:nitroreductase|uniref:nitroreductase n=1 Tax=Brevundimonas sp. TaxID=1871086 RepID=UPI0035635B09
MMDIVEAVETRRSVRRFLDRPVDRGVLEEALRHALRAPSGGNLQPWWLHVVAGEDLRRLQDAVRMQAMSGVFAEEIEYDIYPPKLASPYRDRRFELGEAMYAQIGIPREDKAGRQRWFMRNFECFGAPILLLCTVDRSMGKPQWSDLGMVLQTLMLLLRGQGIDSCAQECWALYPQTIDHVLDLPRERMLFTGMSIGYADPAEPLNQLRSARAPLEEVVEFRGL